MALNRLQVVTCDRQFVILSASYGPYLSYVDHPPKGDSVIIHAEV